TSEPKLNTCEYSQAGDVHNQPLPLVLKENAFTLSGPAKLLAAPQYTVLFQYAGDPKTPTVALGTSCTIWVSRLVQLEQNFPMLFRLIRYIVPTLPIWARYSFPLGRAGKSTTPPEPTSRSLESQLDCL